MSLNQPGGFACAVDGSSFFRSHHDMLYSKHNCNHFNAETWDEIYVKSPLGNLYPDEYRFLS
jgi:hypothetical protein